MSASLVAAMVRHGTYIVPTHLYTSPEYKGAVEVLGTATTAYTTGTTATPSSTTNRTTRNTTPSPAKRTASATPSPTSTQGALGHRSNITPNAHMSPSGSPIAIAMHYAGDDGPKMGILNVLITCIECIGSELSKLAVTTGSSTNTTTISSTKTSPMSPQPTKGASHASLNTPPSLLGVTSSQTVKAVDVLCRLKLRLVSGLGETVFYVSTTALAASKGQVPASSDSSMPSKQQPLDAHRLPVRVIEVLGQVLCDPSNGCQRLSTNAASMSEIMKHYACKVCIYICIHLYIRMHNNSDPLLNITLFADVGEWLKHGGLVCFVWECPGRKRGIWCE
jgi:hypothetical protein